ncbi:MAG: P-II family nitrogen regulator [FCB group bacterium]|nr:P-II family nitrogen regulator [FCB group bacterium]
MKEIKAYIRRSKMDEVIHGLKSIGVKAMSVITVEGIGALVNREESTLSIDYVTNYSLLYKIEIVCREQDTHTIVSQIQKLAHTGEGGDGVIFVSSVEHAVKIRSGEEGHFALDKPNFKAEE